ncbi:hypothetical protein [Pedobacter jejuensis]|uniref:Uncharacterized protein n=1 Tax=Pedobacter jejuensis TaxID=1268550 RepID=A0A3N0BY03_9SPHI|nr:hypothetical protein [Pedobacter jejuensis]RNL54628.1 hypothetical protein D7004_07525 [Pedobacter jejuensis]
MKDKGKTGLKLKMRLSAVILLIVFLMIPVIQAVHHHPDQVSSSSAYSNSFKVFHVKCAVCDYLAHQELKYRTSNFVEVIVPVGLQLPKLSVITIIGYIPFTILFPKANSPPNPSFPVDARCAS